MRVNGEVDHDRRRVHRPADDGLFASVGVTMAKNGYIQVVEGFI